MGDWIVNNDSTYIVLEVIDRHTRDDGSVTYNLMLKNVNTGWHLQAYGVELLDDETVTGIMSNKGYFDKAIRPDDFPAPLFSLSDDEIVAYILKKFTRLTRLEADTEYWFTQAISATDEVEKRRADGFYQMFLVDYIQEKTRVRKSLLTDDKAALFPQRFTYLWNKSIGIVRYYAIKRAKAMREANGIFEKSGLVEYRFFEEEEKSMKKKASVIVCYLATNHGYTIYAIQATTKRSIEMVDFEADPFKSFDTMYKYVLVVLNDHDIEPRYIDTDDVSLFDIAFIEGHNPFTIQRFRLTHAGYRIF